MEEGSGIGSLYQWWCIEFAVTWVAECVIGRHELSGEIGRLIGQILDAGVKIQISGSRTEYLWIGVCSRVEVADVALTQGVI